MKFLMGREELCQRERLELTRPAYIGLLKTGLRGANGDKGVNDICEVDRLKNLLVCWSVDKINVKNCVQGYCQNRGNNTHIFQ